MELLYQDGPYPCQDDYLAPPPMYIRAWPQKGYCRRSDERAIGRLVYVWTREEDGVQVGRSASGATHAFDRAVE